MSKHKLQYDFENAVNAYIEAFCKKQDLTFDFWIADRIGEMAAFTPFWFFTFDDIRRDIDQEIEAGVIKEWHESTMNKDINYISYLMGAR